MSDANPFDALDNVVLDGPVLTPAEPTAIDHLRANYDYSYYSNTLAGLVKGKFTQDWEKMRAIERYDSLPQWQTPMKGLAALAGQVAGAASSPENFLPIGIGEKVIAWTGFKLAPTAARMFAGAIDAGVANAVIDATGQQIEISAGQRQAFDPVQFAASTTLGAVVGGVGGAAVRGLAGEAAPPREAPAKPAPIPGESVTAPAIVEPPRVEAAVPPLGEMLDAQARQLRELGPSTVMPEPARPAPATDMVAVKIGDSFAHDAAPGPDGRRAFDFKPGEQGAAQLPREEASSLVARLVENDPAARPEIVPVKPAAPDAARTASATTGEFSAAAAGSRTGSIARTAGGVAGMGQSPAFTRVKDIADELVTALEGGPVRQGRLSAKVGSKSAAGQYSPVSGVIRVAKPDDFDVLTHELGHHFERFFGKRLQALITAHAQELEPLAYAGHAKGQTLREGFAEFMRIFATNPAHAATVAPNFDAALRGFLARERPDMLQALGDAAAAWRAWMDQPSADAVASTIVSSTTPKRLAGLRKDLDRYGLGRTIAEWLSGAYSRMFDDLHPIARAVNGLARLYRENTGKPLGIEVASDPYKLARLSRGAWNAGHLDITGGVVPYRGTEPQSASLRDALITALGKPNVLSGWDDEAVRRFGAYLWSRRALGEWDRFDAGLIPNPPDKLTRADHEMNVRESEQAFPGFSAAAQMIYDWNRALWTKKRDAGLITDEQWAEGLKIRDYVPGLRAFDQEGDAPGGIGGRGAQDGKAGFVRHFRGSRRDVINPVESLMADAYETAMAIARNDVIKYLDRLARLAGPGAGAFAEPIPSHRLAVTMVDPLEAAESAARAAGMSKPDIVVLRDAIEAAVGDKRAAIFRPAVINEKGEAIAFWRDGGELKALRLADGEFGRQMYAALTTMTRHEKDIWIELLAKPAAVLRLGVTSAPEFWLANLIRDQATAMIYYGRPLARLAGTARGMWEEVMGREVARAYNRAGGIMGGANVSAVTDMRVRHDLNALARKGWLTERLTSLKGLLEITELSETGMRLGLFRTFFDEAKGRGLSDLEAQIEAAYRARDHLDFSRHGSAMTGLARLVPFLNAALQGTDKTVRHMIAPFFREALTDADRAARQQAAMAWARLGAVTVAGMGIHALMSQIDEYNDLSPETRGTHWMIRWGAKWFAVPKPFELAAIINLGEAAYDAVARRDPRWAANYLEGLMSAAMPPDVMEGNPLVRSAYEARTGTDIQTGAPLVPEELRGMEPFLQFTARTSELSKALGRAINRSPVVIDHMITNFTGSIGRSVLAMYDYALSDKPLPGWDDMAITRRFIKDGSRGSQSTRAFWDLVSTRTGKLEGARRSYQALVEAGDAARAADFLAAQDAITRTWIAAGPLDASVRRIHPFERARGAVTAINMLRRDMAGGTIRTAKGDITVSAVDRGAADDILEDLAMTEARNALVMLKVPGWDGRQMIETATYFRELQAISPDLSRALADRLATARVLPLDAVERLWPELDARLRRDGSEARVSDLKARASVAGFEMAGKAMKRKPRAKVPGQ
jgi:hypothetical protein